ncbi:MAG: flavin reductase family protein [Armatimonadota bacterium]
MRQVEIAEAFEARFPVTIVMVISRDEQGRADIMPAGWNMQCSTDPKLVAVAIHYDRCTYRCIKDRGEYVWAWPGEGQGQIVEQTGSCHGDEVDKFAEFDIPHCDGVATDVPLLEGAAANLECRVVDEFPTGDHAIFVGEVVAAHLPDAPIRKIDNFSGSFVVADPRRE